MEKVRTATERPATGGNPIPFAGSLNSYLNRGAVVVPSLSGQFVSAPPLRAIMRAPAFPKVWQRKRGFD